jgi:Tol biopolymer transport system component
MRRRVLGVVGALVGLMCVGEVSASADPVVRNGPIAFAGDRTGSFEIYRMRQDGSHVRRLTHTAAGRASIFSDWSPDGRWIAFDSDRRGNVQLFVMNRNGGQVRQVTHNAQFNGDPSFSPDGSRLVFEQAPNAGCCSNIYSIRLDGSGLRKLTHFTKETFASEPEYSPDGRWIAFAKFPPGGSRSAIFVIRANGGHLHRVTRQSLDAGHPSWSPDGRWIIFNDNFTQPVGDIFTIRPAGSGLTRLTFVEGRGQADYRPDYSPDGTKIVFNHIAGADQPPEVWVMRANGSGKHRISDPAVGAAFAPRWGPLPED